MRSLPQSIEAEQSVIGSMIIDKNAIAKVLESLEEEDFYRDGHKVIYKAILEMFRNDMAVDLVTLLEYLKSTEMLERAGGVTYITEVSSSVPSTANLSSYIKIVSDKSTLRKLIKASTTIIEESYNNQSNVESVVDVAEKKIFNIAENRTSKDFESLGDVLERGFMQIEKLFNNKGEVTGIPSGFTDLDAKTSGFQSGDMVLIAARPSMGKTTFALNIAEHVALREHKSVVIFSLEMSKEQLAYKLLCSEANVDMLKLRTGTLDDQDWENIAMASGPLSKAKIYIDDTAGVTVMEMRSKCRRLKMEKGLDLILIDYLQLMEGEGKNENRQQEIAKISRSLKILAKELDCPVVALSQLSRSPELRKDHRPILSDLRESGSIEQDADIVMFLYRDEYYHDDSEKKNIGEVIVAKNRHGETGNVELVWFGQVQKFADKVREV